MSEESKPAITKVQITSNNIGYGPCPQSEDEVEQKLPIDKGEQVRKFKETEKGVEYMCKELRKLYNDGVAEGELEKAKKATIKLAAKKTPIPEIADILEVSTEQVEIWLGLKKTVV